MGDISIYKIAKDNTLLIDSMMKKFKYFPNNTKFESMQKEIPDNQNFSIIFNNFLLKLKDFDKSFTTNYLSSKMPSNSECRSYLFDYMKQNDKEVADYIGKIWNEQIERNICHIYLFLILVDKYIQLHGKISDYDKNILYWTILYHDLGKFLKINPLIEEKIELNCYDKTHPFKSLIIFLDNVFKHNLLHYTNDEYKNELKDNYNNEFKNSIFKSWKFEEERRKYNISFDYIDIIEKFFMKIKSEEKNEWIYDICVLISFHQSLPNNDYRMNYPLLDEKYIKIFFSKRLVELMRIIMIYDSCSHTLFNGSDWISQINKNMDKVIKLYN